MSIAHVLTLIIVAAIAAGVFLGAYFPDAPYSAELMLAFVICNIGWWFWRK